MNNYANYLYIAIRAALDPRIERRRKGNTFCRTFRLGYALDRGPVGRDEGVYQEKR